MAGRGALPPRSQAGVASWAWRGGGLGRVPAEAGLTTPAVCAEDRDPRVPGPCPRCLVGTVRFQLATFRSAEPRLPGLTAAGVDVGDPVATRARRQRHAGDANLGGPGRLTVRLCPAEQLLRRDGPQCTPHVGPDPLAPVAPTVAPTVALTLAPQCPPPPQQHGVPAARALPFTERFPQTVPNCLRSARTCAARIVREPALSRRS